MHFLIIVLFKKTLVLKNNIIKYKQICNLCFEVTYLYPHLSFNLLIYSLISFGFYLLFIKNDSILYEWVQSCMIFFSLIFLIDFMHVYIYHHFNR